MFKMKYILPFATIALVACKQEPIPGQAPTPPTPPVKKERVFPTATNVETVVANVGWASRYADSTYTLNIGDMPLSTEQNDRILPDAITIAAKLTNLTLWKTGSVYTAGDNKDNKIIWSLSGFKQHGMPIKPNPTNGALPYAQNMSELAGFRNLGYTSMESIVVPDTEVQLTAENAVRFNDYLIELGAEFPDGIVLDINDIIIQKISMQSLKRITSDNISTTTGNIIIKDSRFRCDTIVGTNTDMEWGWGDGTTRSGEWFKLSEANGVTPTICRDDPQFQDKPVPINIGNIPDKNIIRSNISLLGDSLDFKGVKLAVLPNTKVYSRDSKGRLSPQLWSFNASKLAIVADGDLDKLLTQEPNQYVEYGKNVEQVYIALRDMDIQIDDRINLNHEQMKVLTGTQMIKLHPTKQGLDLPEWAKRANAQSIALLRQRQR